MFENIPQSVKTALYESAATDYAFDENGDEMLIIVYEREDVEHIANLFSVDFDELNAYWLDFLGVERVLWSQTM